MPIQDLIEVASGTVTGRDHTFCGNLVLGKPNQDAIATAWVKDAFVAVLCDGCSSGEHSEVGSNLFARMLLNDIIHLMNESRTLQSPGVFSFGDCAVWMNGQMNHVTFPGNAPPYPGYRMLPSDKVKINPEGMAFRCIRTSGLDIDVLNAASGYVVCGLERIANLLSCVFVEEGISLRKTVETYFLCTATVVIIDETILDFLPIVVGTDGLADVPDPSVFLEDRMFANPANVTRALRRMNQPTARIGGDPPRLIKTDGALPDDTTLVAIRRKSCA